MREKLRNAVIAACRLWARDSSCGCYTQCVSCSHLGDAIQELTDFEDTSVEKATMMVPVCVDPPESREALGDDTDFEGEYDEH